MNETNNTNKNNDTNKLEIIKLFQENVKGKKINLENYNKKHCGKEGHWIETQMKIKHNSKNEPDLFGYEMKKESAKISFGDYSASEYLFSKEKSIINKYNKWNEKLVTITKEEFIKFFGTKKISKNNRYSWSGECVPKYGTWNNCGQILSISDNNICIYYSYSKDKRDLEYKNILPDYLKQDNILIVIWKKEKLKNHINNKFNNNGFFIIKKNNDVYDKICFGKAFNYEHFIDNIKKSIIIFDSGMYVGNNRNYSQFRTTNSSFWNELITDEY